MNGSMTLVWGAREWLPIACAIAAVFFLLLLWSYWRSGLPRFTPWIAAGLKVVGILILVLCLLEPLFSGSRARPGANLFLLLADNSQSMLLRDRAADTHRGDQLKSLVAADSPWLSQLGRDFDVRQYAFDTQFRPLAKLDDLAFDGQSSSLGSTLDRIERQYANRPVAGIFLFTDGNATDAAAIDRLLSRIASGDKTRKIPPIYPVPLGSNNAGDDITLQTVAITQTNFEDAPVTLNATVTASGFSGKSAVAQLIDESGAVVSTQNVRLETDGRPAAARFQFRPTSAGLSFYTIRVAAEGALAQFDNPDRSTEATLLNNTRLVSVDRGKGPYRVLYIAGRPNWEFKFLQRALAGDDQVQLTSILRIARREPKFNFLSRAGEETNPLYRGFDPQNTEQVEQYDQPVLVRQGLAHANELSGGFPKTPDELYPFHAIILDDLESEFFTQDQMQLLKDFVRQRGGGLLMLGGQESFKNGRFDRTPIGDVLPVYANEVPATPSDALYRLSLSREGWLEPWIRLRSDEDSERKRIDAMPVFRTINPIRGIKPGATVLAHARLNDGSAVPALVEQRFGRGRAGALLIGDLWRWGIRRAPDAEHDLEKSWRQTIRWLVSEVPQRVEVAVAPVSDGQSADNALNISIDIRDEAYLPLDNAAAIVRVTGPDGKTHDLTAEPIDRKPGTYQALYVPRQSGPYRATILASAPDGSEIAQVQAGWVSQPAAEEFKQLIPNRDLLNRIASATGGQIVPPSDLPDFVSTLPTRNAQITEPYIQPVWHQTWVFALAILCFCAEWGLRRWKGLP